MWKVVEVEGRGRRYGVMEAGERMWKRGVGSKESGKRPGGG